MRWLWFALVLAVVLWHVLNPVLSLHVTTTPEERLALNIEQSARYLALIALTLAWWFAAGSVHPVRRPVAQPAPDTADSLEQEAQAAPADVAQYLHRKAGNIDQP